MLATGNPLRWDGPTPVGDAVASPELGDDTEEVLADLLDLKGEDVAALREKGVL